MTDNHRITASEALKAYRFHMAMSKWDATNNATLAKARDDVVIVTRYLTQQAEAEKEAADA